ncbi:MAG: SPOR domain-containing protein [Candidatus Stahlbacteria bacterium]|nr:SPOR domain-containing protein [Candidatus Stahlbacteria bacterium]
MTNEVGYCSKFGNQKLEVRNQRSEIRGQKSSVFCSLSSVICLLFSVFCYLFSVLCLTGCAGHKSSVQEQSSQYPLLYLDKDKSLGDTLAEVRVVENKNEKDTLYLVMPSNEIEGLDSELEYESNLEQNIYPDTAESDTIYISIPDVETAQVSTEETNIPNPVPQENGTNLTLEPLNTQYSTPNSELSPLSSGSRFGGTNFAVQVGAFRDKKYADKLYKLVKNNYNASVQIEFIDDYWKVRIANHYSYKEANLIKSSLRNHMPSWIVKTKY